jgi:hypothetical protein
MGAAGDLAEVAEGYADLTREIEHLNTILADCL